MRIINCSTRRKPVFGFHPCSTELNEMNATIASYRVSKRNKNYCRELRGEARYEVSLVDNRRPGSKVIILPLYREISRGGRRELEKGIYRRYNSFRGSHQTSTFRLVSFSYRETARFPYRPFTSRLFMGKHEQANYCLTGMVHGYA